MATTRFTVDSMEQANRMMIDESDTLMICGENGSQSAAAEYATEQDVEAIYCPIL